MYTNIAETAIAYLQCYNPISYSGHPRGSKQYRCAKMWGGGGGVHEGHLWPWPIIHECQKFLADLYTFVI